MQRLMIIPETLAAIKCFIGALHPVVFHPVRDRKMNRVGWEITNVTFVHIFSTSMLLSSPVLDSNPSPTFPVVLSADKLQVQTGLAGDNFFRQEGAAAHTLVPQKIYSNSPIYFHFFV